MFEVPLNIFTLWYGFILFSRTIDRYTCIFWNIQGGIHKNYPKTGVTFPTSGFVVLSPSTNGQQRALPAGDRYYRTFAIDIFVLLQCIIQ